MAEEDFKLKRVYFYWICPDMNAFEWLHDLLRYYDKQMADTGYTDFLKYFVFLTRGWDTNLVGFTVQLLSFTKDCGQFESMKNNVVLVFFFQTQLRFLHKKYLL